MSDEKPVSLTADDKKLIENYLIDTFLRQGGLAVSNLNLMSKSKLDLISKSDEVHKYIETVQDKILTNISELIAANWDKLRPANSKEKKPVKKKEPRPEWQNHSVYRGCQIRYRPGNTRAYHFRVLFLLFERRIPLQSKSLNSPRSPLPG